MVSATCQTFPYNRQQDEPAGAEVAFVVEHVKAALTARAVSYIEHHQEPWRQTLAFVRNLNGFLVKLCNAIED